jgi:FkbM family methyltransferase
MLKSWAKGTIRNAVFCAPQALREIMLATCVDRLRLDQRYSRLLPACKLVEIAAEGDRGIVTSSANDTMVLCEYARSGTFAPNLTEILMKFFGSEGGTYVDIGANIGLMTIPLARNPRIHCLAFEPEPVNFGLLQRNLSRNAPGNAVELHQIALYKSRALLSLAVADGNIGDHRLITSEIPSRQTIKVIAQPLDDFLDRISEPLAVKIDTQGAEPFIIAGGHKVLAKADLLVFEFCPFLMRQLGGDPEILIDLVAGFERVAVTRGGKPDHPSFERPAQASTVLRKKLVMPSDTDQDYLDVIAVRRQAVDRLANADHC